jgi:hypothetical protein
MTPITLDNQENVVIASEPLFQNWGPITRELFYNPIELTEIDPFSVSHKIKDVFGSPLEEVYSEFRYFIIPEFLGTNIPFLTITGSSPIGSSNPISLVENNTEFELTYTPENLITLDLGMYQCRVRFVLQGLNASGIWQTIEFFDYTLNLVVDYVIPSQTNLYFFHFQNATLPYIDYAMDGDNWVLRGRANFVFSSSTPGVVIDTLNPSTGLQYRAVGSGPAIIRITLGEYFDSVSVPNVFTSSMARIVNGQNATINISVYTFESEAFNATPNTLSFNAIKNIQEAESQQIIAFSESEIVVENSPWIEIVSIETQTSEGVDFKIITVKPIDSSNFNAGTFNGFVRLKSVIDFENFQKTIAISHTVQDFVTNPNTDYAFTLDPFFYEFTSQLEDTYFEISANLKAFKFFTGEEKIFNFYEKIPLFQKRGKINFGLKIQRVLDKFSSPNENYLQYAPAEFLMEVVEKELRTNAIVRNFTSDVQKYYAGFSQYVSGSATFLDGNPHPRALTNKAFAYLNFLIPETTYELCLYKNNNEVSRQVLDSTSGWVASLKVSFEDFNPGDVVKYTLEPFGITSENPPSKVFLIFPEGLRSNVVVFEDEFLVQNVVEFKGALEYKTDREQVTFTTYQNLVEVLDILESTRTSKLTIYTGWLSKNCQFTIDSLMSSKRVWINNSGTWVPARPITKSLFNEDSERDLYDFAVEFQLINQYNEKNYSFQF